MWCVCFWVNVIYLKANKNENEYNQQQNMCEENIHTEKSRIFVAHDDDSVNKEKNKTKMDTRKNIYTHQYMQCILFWCSVHIYIFLII